MAGAFVYFNGSRDGQAPLSWGQRAIWGAIQRLVPRDNALNMGWITAIEDEGIGVNTTIDRLIETVHDIVTRHESLRTVVGFDDSGEPYQVLRRSGEIAIDIVDVPRESAAEAAVALKERLLEPGFSYATELPLRVGAVRCGGYITHAVFIVCHLATDRGGLNPLVRDVLLALAGKPLPPLDAAQPLDQATYQASAAGQRQSEKALRYWERQLQDVPTQRFGSVVAAQEPRYWNAILNSPAMDKAVSLIAARQRVSSAAVLLAAASFMLTKLTDRAESVVQVIVGNRFRSGYADAVCPAAQDGLCVVHVGESSFPEVVSRAMRASMNAYVHSQYDPSALDSLIERLGVDLSCSYNDRRFDSQSPVTETSPQEVRDALPATTFHWDPPLEKYGARYFLHINAAPKAIELCLFADTEVLAPEAMERYLRGMETVTIQAALELDGLLTGS